MAYCSRPAKWSNPTSRSTSASLVDKYLWLNDMKDVMYNRDTVPIVTYTSLQVQDPQRHDKWLSSCIMMHLWMTMMMNWMLATHTDGWAINKKASWSVNKRSICGCGIMHDNEISEWVSFLDSQTGSQAVTQNTYETSSSAMAERPREVRDVFDYCPALFAKSCIKVHF